MPIHVIDRIGKRAAVDLVMVALNAAHHTTGYVDDYGGYPFNVFDERSDDLSSGGRYRTVETIEPLIENDCVTFRVDGSKEPDKTFHHFGHN